MSVVKDPFEVEVVEESAGDFAALSRKPVGTTVLPPSPLSGAVTARFHGYDLDEQPLLGGLQAFPGQIVRARTTIPLLSSQVGAAVLVVFEGGDVGRPIVIGALQDQRPTNHDETTTPRLVSVHADAERLTLSAEREIVLRCGDASITLTRAGKVIIDGTYVLNRSSGYNKIKGAAVDIN